MHRRKLDAWLTAYLASHPDEEAVVTRFRQFMMNHERCFARDCWAGHITGAAWVGDPGQTAVLLTHHRKLNIWVQLGGHSDGDPNTARVARKEAEEESGLEVDFATREIFDLDVHEIPARHDAPAHEHYDVRFAFVAKQKTYVVSAESNDLQWVQIEDLEAFTQEESILRMGRKWRAYQGKVSGVDRR